MILTKQSAFFGSHSEIEEVILPETLKAISVGAFFDCKRLREVILPSNVMEINEFAFRGCISLEKVFIPQNCEFISEYAFIGCNCTIFTPLSKAPKGWNNAWNQKCKVIWNYRDTI